MLLTQQQHRTFVSSALPQCKIQLRTSYVPSPQPSFLLLGPTRNVPRVSLMSFSSANICQLGPRGCSDCLYRNTVAPSRHPGLVPTGLTLLVTSLHYGAREKRNPNRISGTPSPFQPRHEAETCSFTGFSVSPALKRQRKSKFILAAYLSPSHQGFFQQGPSGSSPQRD